MNERIEKLAEQAVLQANEVFDQKGKDYPRIVMEKFAELIVREMLVTCEDHPAWTGRMIGNQIKQHFGVEE